MIFQKMLVRVNTSAGIWGERSLHSARIAVPRDHLCLHRSVSGQQLCYPHRGAAFPLSERSIPGRELRILKQRDRGDGSRMTARATMLLMLVPPSAVGRVVYSAAGNVQTTGCISRNSS
jgi:hypothetical protein